MQLVQQTTKQRFVHIASGRLFQQIELFAVARTQLQWFAIEARSTQVNWIHWLAQDEEPHCLAILLQPLTHLSLVEGRRRQRQVQEFVLHVGEDFLVLASLVSFAVWLWASQELEEGGCPDVLLQPEHTVKVPLQSRLTLFDECGVLIPKEPLARKSFQICAMSKTELVVKLADLAVPLLNGPRVTIWACDLDGVNRVPVGTGVSRKLQSVAFPSTHLHKGRKEYSTKKTTSRVQN
mmetsp:Transcript_44058/g.116523  ORF Transcript_44058/g.116523 Transcript_44058/m.116523 type:complete len:236 (-) Transcript_44058:20-727(-)